MARSSATFIDGNHNDSEEHDDRDHCQHEVEEVEKDPGRPADEPAYNPERDGPLHGLNLSRCVVNLSGSSGSGVFHLNSNRRFTLGIWRKSLLDVSDFVDAMGILRLSTSDTCEAPRVAVARRPQVAHGPR
jgi:hypothetical protein